MLITANRDAIHGLASDNIPVVSERINSENLGHHPKITDRYPKANIQAIPQRR